MPQARSDPIRDHRREAIPVSAMLVIGRIEASQEGQSDPRGGGWWQVLHLRIRSREQGAGVPSPRPRREVVRYRTRWSHEVDRGRQGRGIQMRPSLCELSCRGRGGTRSTAATMRSARRGPRQKWTHRVSRSRVADRQCNTLLTCINVGSNPTPGAPRFGIVAPPPQPPAPRPLKPTGSLRSPRPPADRTARSAPPAPPSAACVPA